MGGRNSGGFVLISVLLVLAIVSAIVVAAVASARSVRIDATLERRLAQASAIADAGLTHIVAALEATDTPLSADLLDARGKRWRFADRDVLISLRPETAKVDLNAGDPDLVISVLHAVIRDQSKADRLIRRLAAMRRARQDLEAVQGLLDPDDRMSPLARDLESVFTVWTGLRGVDPKYTSSFVIRNLPGLQEGEAALIEQARDHGSYADLSPFITRFGPLLQSTRPIYRARAEVIMDDITVRREALLAFDEIKHIVSVVFWRDAIDDH